MEKAFDRISVMKTLKEIIDPKDLPEYDF